LKTIESLLPSHGLHRFGSLDQKAVIAPTLPRAFGGVVRQAILVDLLAGLNRCVALARDADGRDVASEPETIAFPAPAPAGSEVP
jgi:hypothetical protein